jgi:SAM-dependent methyltransferase
MDWRLKALGHWVVSASPRSDAVGYFMQRRVTRSLPMADDLFFDHVAAAERHLGAAVTHTGREVRTAYEFGAGWDLVVPFALARAGVRRQTLTDVRPLARTDLIADTARRLRMEPDLDHLGITYLAPRDGAATGLPSGTFDLVSSTDTLEHIPPAQLRPVLSECLRLLAPGGIFSARIDYRDHYSYGDPKVSAFQFLRYGATAWRRWNPPSHYQSRLRHSDHVRALTDVGFELLDVSHPAASEDALGDVHKEFAGYGPSDLAIPEAWIVARAVAR